MTDNYALKIILLGANDRGLLAIAKELSKRFYIIAVDWQDMHVKHSKFIDEYIVISNIENDATQFVNDLINISKTKNVKYILPINDAALEVCDKFFDSISKVSTIMGYLKQQYIYSHNKYTLLETAQQLNIKTPKSKLINSLNEFNDFIKTGKLHFPLVCKPIHSKLIKDNKLYSFNVKIVNNEKEIIDFFRENINNISIIIQEYISKGTGVGFNFLSIDGISKKHYAHQRITEPLNGGQSSYRKTIKLEKYNILETSNKIINKINWTGIGMLEYKMKDGKLYLMELNGRVWGSVMLGTFSGINIPNYFINNYFFSKQLSTTNNYKIRYLRNLKLDIKYIIERFKETKNPIILIKWFFSLFKCLLPIEKIEDNPIINFNIEIPYIFNILKQKTSQKLCNHINNKIILKKPIIKQNSKIAFICTGNICRSPFAELYAKKNFPNYTFSSFGFIQQENRLSSVNSEKAAKQFDIDITTHKSRATSLNIIEKFDILFIMDSSHYFKIKENFPEHLNKTYFLDNKEIIDPYSKNVEQYIKTYTQITQAINNLKLE